DHVHALLRTDADCRDIDDVDDLRRYAIGGADDGESAVDAGIDADDAARVGHGCTSRERGAVQKPSTRTRPARPQSCGSWITRTLTATRMRGVRTIEIPPGHA